MQEEYTKIKLDIEKEKVIEINIEKRQINMSL